jgi:alkaline phosphatase
MVNTASVYQTCRPKLKRSHTVKQAHIERFEHMGFKRARLARRSVLLVVLVAVLVLCIFTATALAASSKNAHSKAAAKNVIVMIADGAGYNTLLATDYYQFGDAGTQIYERFPYRFAVSTYPAGASYDSRTFWTNFNYRTATDEGNFLLNHALVTESNMAATAMGTGIKSQEGVGLNASMTRVTNIMEIAETLGKATGVVSTQSFSEATPAGFSAHATDRKALKAITEQQLRESRLDVVMGAYNPWYNNNGERRAAGLFSPTSKYLWTEATWNALAAGTLGNNADTDEALEYWTLIEDRADFQAMATGPTPERVAGVAQCSGDDGVGSGYTQFYRTGAANDAPFATPWLETSPTLTEMSLAALNVLDNDPDGFVAMFEGANVDYGSHFGWIGRAIEEYVEFNDAVEAVCDWVETNSSWDDTLLIVTTDHETGGIWGPGAGTGTARYPGDPAVYVPIVDNGIGNVPGVVYYNHRPKYGPDFYWHSNALVPLFAKGAGSSLFTSQVRGKDLVRGLYVDNTSIFQVMKKSITK